MNLRTKRTGAILASIFLLILLLDNRNAFLGAQEGIELCIKSVIPSLFPLLAISSYLVPIISGTRFSLLSKLLGVPAGLEAIFVIGCIGGYPVGAQCLCQGVQAGMLRKEDAQPMLGICTNCGPSFIFGVVGALFSSSREAAAILAIGIIGAIINNLITPHAESTGSVQPSVPVTFPQALNMAVRSMAGICAWVILGRIAVSFCEARLGMLIPLSGRILLSGMLELTNGCIQLRKIASYEYRFILAAFFTGFGGLCVAMQVNALCHTAGVSAKGYLTKKFRHGLICALLAYLYQIIPGPYAFRLILISCIPIISLRFFKKSIAIPRKLVYNGHA